MYRGGDYYVDEEGYGMNDDFDDDDGYDGKPPKLPVSKPGFWQCSICTYDNDQRFSSCDICGVFRDSCDIHVVEKGQGTCKSPGASIMARSLFAQTSHAAPTIAVISDVFQCKEVNKSNEKGNIRARFVDLQKAFMARSYNRTPSIAPFRFDIPSPDDIVYARKNYSRITSKADPMLSMSTKASSSDSGKKGIMKFLPNNEMPDKSSSSESSHLGETESNSIEDSTKAPHVPTHNLHNLKLEKKPVSSRKVEKSSQYKPEKWILSDQEGTLNQLNLAVVGHVDSGKSSLCGRLLHLLGRISRKEMHKFEEAKEKGKGSFAYAWAMDETAEERERGITMAVGVAYFNTKNYRIVLLDSPGHKDFVPKMISGVTLADAAILVVDASVDSFEEGMEVGGVGQTKEHAQLIRSFGVDQIIVAVNKMDVVEFSKERFDSVKLQLGSFLRSCGFKESSVTWIPLSVMRNQNLLTTASDDKLCSWYHGCCLLDAIDSLQLPHRDLSKPLILPICDVIALDISGHVAASGKLETGAIRNGLKVLVLPSGDSATVRSIKRDSDACSIAWAGDHVAVTLQGIDGPHVMPGGVLCHPDFPVKVASSLELKVLVLDITTPILIGCQVEFLAHHATEAARVVKLVSLLDQKTGHVLKRTPRFLSAKQSAIIEVNLDRSICVEEFSNCRALGRAFLRASGSTIAVGIVTRVLGGA